MTTFQQLNALSGDYKWSVQETPTATIVTARSFGPMSIAEINVITAKNQEFWFVQPQSAKRIQIVVVKNEP